MSTYRQIFYQIVFNTKNREATLNKGHAETLYKYILGITYERHCKLYRIGGTEDHLHILSDLHPSISLADYIKAIKQGIANRMKRSRLFPRFDSWQNGSGAFTYGINEKQTIIDCIKNQKEHHQTETFYDEYKRLLAENGIEFDEKYLL